jgi:hypothetical protein
MPDGNGSRAWRQDMAALEKAHKELEDSFIVLTQVETRMSQLLREQTEYVASHEKRLQEQAERDRVIEERIEKLVSAIGDLIARTPPENLPK